MIYVKPERLSLRLHPEFSERRIQGLIADDPAILGLGDLRVIERERIQPGAGRLDLLLQDTEGSKRYEVELQLGATDETHIIRTIEYWDIERKRYPAFQHCAVLMAENVTGRFLNVVSLLNGNLAIVALQMQAIKIGEVITIVFTKVLDEFALAASEEDDSADPPRTSRRRYSRLQTKIRTIPSFDRKERVINST